VDQPLRIDRVRVRVGDEMVELSWAVAQELQARMLRSKATESLLARFQRAGTSRPVDLDDADWGPLLVVVAQWGREVGRDKLPAGVGDLLGALTTNQ